MREARRLVFAAMLVIAAMPVMLMPAYARAVTDEKNSDLVTSGDDQSDAATVIPEYQTIDELAGKTVGTGAGGVYDQLVRANAPEITDFMYYETYADMVAALKAKRIDAFLMDKPVCELLVSRNSGITLLPESLVDDDYGFALTKNSPLTERLNKVIERFWADGTIEALHDKWMGADEDAKTMPEMDWDTSAGTLRVALDNTIEPLAYMRDSEIVGYDVELVMLCAKELGMGVEFSSMTFVAMLSSVQSGKADVGVGCISITDERRQKMDLTVPTYYGAATFVVRDVGDPGQASSSFAEDFAASFERTFIVENRWKLVVAGLGVTVLITLLASAAGMMLGFALPGASQRTARLCCATKSRRGERIC